MKKGIIFIAFIAALLCFGVCFVTQKEPPVNTIQVGGDELPVKENVDKNELEREKFYTDGGRVYYDDPAVRYGIDVSSHQGDIDWEKVKADGIDFAIIRAGYRGYGSAGTINADDYFEKNVKGALANGIDVGVYFFSQAITVDEAKEEASFVLDLIDGYDIKYPVFFDWEYITYTENARTHDYQSFDISSFANAFANEVSEKGYRSSVYFNPNYGYRLYDIEEISEHSFWLAEYKDVPNFYYGFSIWQYSNSGSVSGVKGEVDMDISFTELFDKTN